jgi:phosphate-selective porin
MRRSPLACLPVKGAGLLLSVVWLFVGTAALGQSPESQNPEGATPRPGDAPKAVPDVPGGFLDSLQLNTKYFTLRPGLAVLGDYTWFTQNAASLAQVGEQENKAEFRSFRVILHGTFRLFIDWQYLVSYEYKGFDHNDDDPDWAPSDVYIQTRIPWLGQLRLGRQKESFVYEMVGDAANLPQDERLMSPFFVSRNTGISLSNTFLCEHATWTIGWFNDWWTKGQSFHGSGNDLAARVTFLPFDDDSGKHYLHLAVAGRYYGGDDDTLRFRGKPESNVADYFVDTGNLHADHAWLLGLEALYANGPFSVLAEYDRAWVPSASLGDPSFSGYYVTVSWVFTGEPRPYDKKVAYARRPPVAKHRWGALELVGRYGHLDLDGGAVRGGRLDKWYGGINWFATRRWKFGFGYGNADLDRSNISDGRTNIFLTRIQWIF